MNAVFTSASANAKPGAKPPAPSSARPAQTSVVRLQSRNLVYAENDHKAVFSGAVVAQTSSGILHSSFMDVYFTPAPAVASSNKTPGPQGGQVSKIVARGAVQLEQEGRKGTGEDLTYTAEDGKFVLTGTSAVPPRITDQIRGTVTGGGVDFQ